MITILSQVALAVAGIIVLGTYVEGVWRRWKLSAKQLLDKCLLTGTLGLAMAGIVWLSWRYCTNLLAVFNYQLRAYLKMLNDEIPWLEGGRFLEHQVSVRLIVLACLILLGLRIIKNLLPYHGTLVMRFPKVSLGVGFVDLEYPKCS
jgi:hypothetical protein